ncbi:MAG TPA: GDP-mannose 4,6-dehydratase [Burkholderiales bacterium]|nr:GDP-mannose 4,6-dehydratase [Burkholderiales bacterium]
MKRKALICGISGQDGAYLARLLLDKGYAVAGTSRDAGASGFANLERLGVRARVALHSTDVEDFRSVLQTLERAEPDEVYNLAGQSSVGLSFEQPVEAFESIAVGTLNLLESIRFLKKPIRLYNACSSECFGDTGERPANEDTPFQPRSPYATAKATAFWSVANYREAYDLWACSGILFNHESPLRPERFVTRKIVAAAQRIAAGSNERLRLGNLAVVRDWGWAPEYVEAMWRMLQPPAPRDYVVATGVSVSLENFLHEVFSSLGLDWRRHVDVDPTLERPLDPGVSRADPGRAERELGWHAQCRMPELARRLVQGEQESNWQLAHK